MPIFIRPSGQGCKDALAGGWIAVVAIRLMRPRFYFARPSFTRAAFSSLASFGMKA